MKKTFTEWLKNLRVSGNKISKTATQETPGKKQEDKKKNDDDDLMTVIACCNCAAFV